MNSGQSGSGYSPIIFYNRYPWGYHSQQHPSDFPRCKHNPYVADDMTKRQIHNQKEQRLDQLFLGPEQLTTHTWQLTKEPGIEQYPGTMEQPIRKIHDDEGYRPQLWHKDEGIIEHFGNLAGDSRNCITIIAVIIALILFFYSRKK